MQWCMSHPGLCNRCAYLSHCSAFRREASTLSEAAYGKMVASEPGHILRSPVQWRFCAKDALW